VHRPRRLAGLIALLLTLGTVSCGQKSVEEAGAPSPGCNLYDHLTEKITSLSLNELGGKYPSLGDSATYVTYLYYADGKKMGTVYGKANVPATLPNGDLLEYSEEVIQLDGGTIDSQGLYDITKGFAGEWQFLPAIGSSGAFKDKLGRRSFHIIKVGESLDASIEVCPVG